MSGRRAHVRVILVVAVLAGALSWGCGGGQTTTTAANGLVPSTVPSGGGSGSVADGLLLTKLKTTLDTPREYVDAVDQSHPVVLLFFVTGSVDDAKVLDTITRLQPAFQDYVFLLYDYKTPIAYGDLSTLLKIRYPPELVLVDGTGTIRAIWNGYVDEGSLNQGLVTIGQQ